MNIVWIFESQNKSPIKKTFGKTFFLRGKFVRRQHDFLPNQGRKRAAADFIHRRIVIVADPDGGNVLIRPTDKPCVAEILRSSGFAGGKKRKSGAPSRAVCYNGWTTTYAEVKKLADEECLKHKTGTHAVPTKMTSFTCRLLIPNHVYFKCVR